MKLAPLLFLSLISASLGGIAGPAATGQAKKVVQLTVGAIGRVIQEIARKDPDIKASSRREARKRRTPLFRRDVEEVDLERKPESIAVGEPHPDAPSTGDKLTVMEYREDSCEDANLAHTLWLIYRAKAECVKKHAETTVNRNESIDTCVRAKTFDTHTELYATIAKYLQCGLAKSFIEPANTGTDINGTEAAVPVSRRCMWEEGMYIAKYNKCCKNKQNEGYLASPKQTCPEGFQVRTNFAKITDTLDGRGVHTLRKKREDPKIETIPILAAPNSNSIYPVPPSPAVDLTNTVEYTKAAAADTTVCTVNNVCRGNYRCKNSLLPCTKGDAKIATECLQLGVKEIAAGETCEFHGVCVPGPTEDAVLAKHGLLPCDWTNCKRDGFCLLKKYVSPKGRMAFVGQCMKRDEISCVRVDDASCYKKDGADSADAHIPVRSSDISNFEKLLELYKRISHAWMIQMNPLWMTVAKPDGTHQKCFRWTTTNSTETKCDSDRGFHETHIAKHIATVKGTEQKCVKFLEPCLQYTSLVF